MCHSVYVCVCVCPNSFTCKFLWQWAIGLVQGSWFLKYHKYWTTTETHLRYPVLAQNQGDLAGSAPWGPLVLASGQAEHQPYSAVTSSLSTTAMLLLFSTLSHPWVSDPFIQYYVKQLLNSIWTFHIFCAPSLQSLRANCRHLCQSPNGISLWVLLHHPFLPYLIFSFHPPLWSSIFSRSALRHVSWVPANT